MNKYVLQVMLFDPVKKYNFLETINNDFSKQKAGYNKGSIIFSSIDNISGGDVTFVYKGGIY